MLAELAREVWVTLTLQEQREYKAIGITAGFCICEEDWTDGTTHCQQCHLERRWRDE